MTDVSDLIALVTARFTAASGSAEEFWSAYDRALASFGKAIAGDAIEQCRGTPQGDAIDKYLIDAVMAVHRSGRLPEVSRKLDQFFADLGLTPVEYGGPMPPKPRPRLRVIEGGGASSP